MRTAIYYSPDKFIRIENKKGNLIFEREFDKPGNTFQLRYKEIITNNRLKLLKIIKPNFSILKEFFKIIKPERKRDFDAVKFFKTYDDNEKAFIYPSLQKIYVNSTFWNSLNEVEKKLVAFHEVGHLFYKTESKCDMFAALICHLMGYPTYAIIKGSRNTLDLSKDNMDRWEVLIKLLEPYQKGIYTMKKHFFNP